MPEYTKSSQQKKMGRSKSTMEYNSNSNSKSTMEYNSGQYATVTHYRRGAQDRGLGYQNRCATNTINFKAVLEANGIVELLEEEIEKKKLCNIFVVQLLYNIKAIATTGQGSGQGGETTNFLIKDIRSQQIDS